MFIAYVVVTVLTAAANVYAASNDFRRVSWIVANMERLGIGQRWMFTLGALKMAGAVGLLVGFVVPGVGVAAAAGLVVFFVGAIVVTLRARWYAHLVYPVIWLSFAVAALALRCLVKA